METKNKFSYLWMTCCLLACLAVGYGTYAYFFAAKDSGEVANLTSSPADVVSAEKGMQKPTHSGEQTTSSIPEQAAKPPLAKTGQTAGDLPQEKLQASDERPKKEPISQSEALVVLSSDGEELVMTVSELKALHRQQEAEAAALQSDEALVPSDDGEGAGMTLSQVKALHEKQEAEFAKQSDDTLVPLSEDEDGVALTVHQLKALHEEQLKQEAASNLYEIADVPLNENDPVMTNWELKALLQSQEEELNATADLQEIEIAPAQDGQGPTVLTVRAIKNLHDQQEKEARITSK